MIVRNLVELIILCLLILSGIVIKRYTRKRVSCLDGAEGIYTRKDQSGKLIAIKL